MKHILSLAPLFALFVFPSQGPAQETADSPQGISAPSDLDKKFDHLDKDKAPLTLGDASDRVRELQLTLNAKLGGRDSLIRLATPVGIGPARGTSRDDPKSQVRIVWIPEWDRAFHIRGDWIPYDESGQPIEWPDTAQSTDFQPVHFLKLPDDPLKVDGVFGQHTQAAVMLFQLEHSLLVTGDVDAVTLDKLEPLLPTNPLLATIMGWVSHIFDPENDSYPYLVKTSTAMIATLLILIASIAVYQMTRMLANSTTLLSRWMFTPSTSPWFTALRENHVFYRIAHFGPALFIWAAGQLIFPDATSQFPYLNTFQNWHEYVSRWGLAYLSVVFVAVLFAFIKACETIYDPDQDVNNPIIGITRAAKRFVEILGVILVVAALAGRNPLLIIGGLGGFMALIVLMFRDYLLGVVASVQIITNKVVKVGDWIVMPKYNADGDVIDMSLTLIKVQNFDKTISTIPTYAVLTESFRNWSGMHQSGGRRIKRAIFIDVYSIRICSPDMVARFEKMELIRDYILTKKAELEEYNRQHDVQASLVNSRRLTNLGTFRAYLDAYLRSHPGLHHDLTFLVRHLQPTNNGLPIEVYAFTKETAWGQYEAIQADIFDHVLAVLPEFELKAFQDVTNWQPPQTETRPPKDASEHLAQIEAMIEKENQKLQSDPRSRLAARLRKVRARIRELGLADTVYVDSSDRTLQLRFGSEPQ